MIRFSDIPQQVLLTDPRFELTWGRLHFRRAHVSVMWIGEGTVPDAARAYLPSGPTMPRFWQVLVGGEFQRRHRVAIGMLVAQLLAVIIAALGFFADDETLIVTGPPLAALGAAFAIVAWPVRTWTILLFGLSAPLTIGGGAVLAALNPRDTEEIFAVVVLYAVMLVLAAPFALAATVSWPANAFTPPPLQGGARGGFSAAAPPAAEKPWQFSMKSILWVMTGTAIFFALCHLLFSEIRNGELQVVALYGILHLTAAAALLARFVYERSHSTLYSSRSA
jgi:hypothetical protein